MASDALLPGGPEIALATRNEEVAAAARLMAAAFLDSQDHAWLAWLPRRDVLRVRAGEAKAVQGKLARVIAYLAHATFFHGG